MKHIKYITSFSLLIGCFLFLSCEYEPVDFEEKPVEEVKPNVVGTYKLTAYNTIATDLDSDGESSANQMDETTCFSETYLILNSDNTFTATQKGIWIVFDGSVYSLDCFYKPDIDGTWQLNGKTVKLAYSENGSSGSMELNLSGNKLVRKINGGQVVTQTGSGEPKYVSANIEMVYSKQN